MEKAEEVYRTNVKDFKEHPQNWEKIGEYFFGVSDTIALIYENKKTKERLEFHSVFQAETATHTATQMVKCPWCGEQVSAEEYSRHYETCPKRPKKTGIQQEELIEALIKAESETSDNYGLLEDGLRSLGYPEETKVAFQARQDIKRHLDTLRRLMDRNIRVYGLVIKET